jgi:intracellular septation protein
MSALYDLLPVLAFFLTYKFAGIYPATVVLMVGTALQVGYTWYTKRTIPKMTLWSGVLMLCFGGATLYFHSPAALMWMPSVLYGTLAALFLASHFTPTTVLERVLGAQLQVPKPIWAFANSMWVAFFIALGLVNYWVLSHYGLDAWVRFKLLKVGVVFVFAIAQALWLSRYAQPPPGPVTEKTGEP